MNTITVRAEPKNGEVTILLRKGPHGVIANVSFIDQFGLTRTSIIGADKSEVAFLLAQKAVMGEAIIFAPEPPIQNAYNNPTP